MPKAKKTVINTKTRTLEAEGFYSDFNTEDTLSAVFIRSPSPTGKIKSITIENLPEGYYLFTADDIPGNKTVKINDTEIKVFGYDNVSFAGEPVGILAGPDEDVLNNLKEEVNIEFDVQTLESALNNVIKKQKKGSEKNENSQDFDNFVETLNEMPSLDTVVDRTHIESKTEELVASRMIKTGAYISKKAQEAEEILLQEGDLSTTNTWSLNLSTPTWKETCGAFCTYEDDLIHVYAPTKWTYLLMKTVSSVLKLPFESVIVHKTISSGSFSEGLWRSALVAARVAVVSYLIKKPVRLIFTQEEEDIFMHPGVDAEFNYTTIMSPEGKIKAIRADVEIDIGAANPFAQEITDRLAIASCNYYTTENLYLNVKAYKSKNPPTSINLKSVSTQAFFAVENQIQTLCQHSSYLPYEIREINIQQEDEYFPFKLNLTDFSKAFLNTVKISDFNRKFVSFNRAVKKRLESTYNPFFAIPLRGMGIASAYNHSGYYGESSFSYNPKVQVTLAADNKVIIHAIKPSEVVQEIWKKSAAEILQIGTENIIIDSTFDIDEIPQSPEDAYSSIGSINELVKKCCTDIQKRRFHEPLPLIAQKTFSTKKEWNKDTFSGNPYGTTAFAALAVEVELDSYTFNEKIKGIWLTVDCGEILDEVSAKRRIRLELQQALSTLVEGKTIPCDNITINFINSNNKSGQIGELIQNTLPAAFSSALSQALDTQLTKLPCTEKLLYELIKDREMEKEAEPEQAEKQGSETEKNGEATEEGGK